MEPYPELTSFLISAKKATYAGEGAEAASSRPASKDLPYQEGDYFYLDSYLGGFAFLGEEAVWHTGQPVWGMNYYGRMLIDSIPEGFSHFLKQALLRVPARAPYRGPAFYQDGPFTYTCAWQGEINAFEGRETIYLHDSAIYTLNFHGGKVV